MSSFPVPGDTPLSSDIVYDCAIIGGGPAGLTAAIFLGRYRRKVLLNRTYRTYRTYRTDKTDKGIRRVPL